MATSFSCFFHCQTLLEKIKTTYNKTPGLPADKIGPTVGQNSQSVFSLCSPRCACPPICRIDKCSISSGPAVGKIALPSSILQFWDLGGQRDIRNIWVKYYDSCHAVAYVVDASDLERLAEGWEVFGALAFCIASQ